MRVDGVPLHPAVGRRGEADGSGGACVPLGTAAAAELPQGLCVARSREPSGLWGRLGALLALGSSRCS